MLKLSIKHKDTVHAIEIAETATFADLKQELQKLSKWYLMQPKSHPFSSRFRASLQIRKKCLPMTRCPSSWQNWHQVKTCPSRT